MHQCWTIRLVYSKHNVFLAWYDAFIARLFPERKESRMIRRYLETTGTALEYIKAKP
jgi:hypothetical protein